MAARPDDAILSLPVDERLALVDSIWESENADVLPIDELTRVEMQRRLDLHRDDPDPDAADDLDVVLARLRAELAGLRSQNDDRREITKYETQILAAACHGELGEGRDAEFIRAHASRLRDS